MSATKAKKAAPPGLREKLPGMVQVLGGSGRPVTVLVILCVALLGAWYATWAVVRDRVLASDSYRIGPQQVEITPVPPWIHCDLRAEVFASASLGEPLSIMDEEFSERIASMFSLHPWVAAVQRVTKHHPARVTVELVYRRPVCMVAMSDGLRPVDAQGILLPSRDFSSVEASRYPRLEGIDTVPLSPAGESWGDARVVGGAQIAAALEPIWSEMKLLHIVPTGPSTATAGQQQVYILVTRGGTQIRWGSAPGSGQPGELSAAEKVMWLKEYFREHGTLDGRSGPQELDLVELPSSSMPPTRP